jgi:hypothetical protein
MLLLSENALGSLFGKEAVLEKKLVLGAAMGADKLLTLGSFLASGSLNGTVALNRVWLREKGRQRPGLDILDRRSVREAMDTAMK